VSKQTRSHPVSSSPSPGFPTFVLCSSTRSPIAPASPEPQGVVDCTSRTCKSAQFCGRGSGTVFLNTSHRSLFPALASPPPPLSSSSTHFFLMKIAPTPCVGIPPDILRFTTSSRFLTFPFRLSGDSLRRSPQKPFPTYDKARIFFLTSALSSCHLTRLALNCPLLTRPSKILPSFIPLHTNQFQNSTPAAHLPLSFVPLSFQASEVSFSTSFTPFSLFHPIIPFSLLGRSLYPSYVLVFVLMCLDWDLF